MDAFRSSHLSPVTEHLGQARLRSPCMGVSDEIDDRYS